MIIQYQQVTQTLKNFNQIASISNKPQLLTIRLNHPHWNIQQKQTSFFNFSNTQITDHKNCLLKWGQSLKSDTLDYVQQLTIYCMWKTDNLSQFQPIYQSINQMKRLKKFKLITTQQIKTSWIFNVSWLYYINKKIKVEAKQQQWRTQSQKNWINKQIQSQKCKNPEKYQNCIFYVLEGFDNIVYAINIGQNIFQQLKKKLPKTDFALFMRQQSQNGYKDAYVSKLSNLKPGSNQRYVLLKVFTNFIS